LRQDDALLICQGIRTIGLYLKLRRANKRVFRDLHGISVVYGLLAIAGGIE